MTTAYMHGFILKGEGCVLFPRVYAFHTVTDRHVMNPNTHRGGSVHELCVCDCVDVCALAPKQISICPVMTRYRAAGDFSLTLFFIWAQLQFNHVFKQQEINCLVWINCLVCRPESVAVADARFWNTVGRQKPKTYQSILQIRDLNDMFCLIKPAQLLWLLRAIVNIKY